jgi:hypothetical protein
MLPAGLQVRAIETTSSYRVRPGLCRRLRSSVVTIWATAKDVRVEEVGTKKLETAASMLVVVLSFAGCGV